MRAVIFCVWLAVVGGLGIGWAMNVLAIVHTIDLPITGMFILRCVGIFAVPLGAVLGWF